MSNTQDIDTNAQTTDDQDVEAHGHLARSDQDALSPRGIHRNDAPDGEDSTTLGHDRK